MSNPIRHIGCSTTGFINQSTAMAARFLLIITLILPGFITQECAAAGMKNIEDFTGRNVQVPAAPQRVISLAPGITEMIYSLGREHLLLATVEFSNYPPQARQIPRIGSYIRPDLEKIVAHRPDLVIATRDGNPRHVIDQLDRLNIPVFAIDPRNLEQIKASILVLGDLLSAEQTAAAIARSMERRLTRIDTLVAHAAHRPLVFFQVDSEPMVSIGEDTFLHELIIRAGGRNAAAGGPPYPRFSWEQLLHIQPEVVIITSMAGGQSPDSLRQQWQRWPQLKAVRDRHIYVVDADLFDRPTQRLVDGLEILARLIQPGLFPADASSQNDQAPPLPRTILPTASTGSVQ